jgi:hypothetical protein
MAEAQNLIILTDEPCTATPSKFELFFTHSLCSKFFLDLCYQITCYSCSLLKTMFLLMGALIFLNIPFQQSVGFEYFLSATSCIVLAASTGCPTDHKVKFIHDNTRV